MLNLHKTTTKIVKALRDYALSMSLTTFEKSLKREELIRT